MRELLWGLLKRFLFALSPETAHHFTLTLVRRISPRGSGMLRIVSGAEDPRRRSAESRAEALGMTFLSRVGLAAGLDKNAEILTALPHLGFGFAEIGTVTPRPQPGNDAPRLFRAPEQDALFNRMGFNNLGAAEIARRVAHAKPALPEGFRVGINLGKNKDTDLAQAARDYADSAAHFEGLADYLVVNVSSPNTPGLRSLQSVESLAPIVEAVKNVLSRWTKGPPLLLKLAPELEEDELGTVLETGERVWGVSGWILTNTLGGTWRRGERELSGGWSGAPVGELSERALARARQRTSLPIISVGGILDPETALKRLQLGASLVQIYSGWVLRGPSLPARIAKKIAENGL